MEALPTCWKQIGIWGDNSCPKLVEYIHCRNCEVFARAAAKLLDRPLPPGFRQEWTAKIAEPRQEPPSGLKPVVIFRIGNEWLALPTEVFVEVGPLKPVHSLPHRTDTTVRGVVNIRGELLICISLGALLGLDAETPVAPQTGAHRAVYRRIAVIGRKSERVAFEVDELHVGHHYQPAALQPIPATVSLATAPHPSYTTGLFAWRGQNVGVMDDDLLFYTLSRNLA